MYTLLSRVLAHVLEQHKGVKSAVQRASLELGVSDATLYNWCRDLGIDIDDYKQPVATVAAPKDGQGHDTPIVRSPGVGEQGV